MFNAVFISIVSKYSNEEQALKAWKEIHAKYSKTSRHYHNINHLENLFRELSTFEKTVSDWEMIIFAIAYHDIIYNVLRQDNEERSAELANERLKKLSIEKDRVGLCYEIIINTKTHRDSTTGDIKLFADADLAILGKSSEEYLSYASGVRKEYKVYPDFVYNPGRSKVLESFLVKDRIYHTDFFYGMYEIKARENISRELELLRKK
jgi:predicted metal-dependent HD superfamily phosphohydrolase